MYNNIIYYIYGIHRTTLISTCKSLSKIRVQDNNKHTRATPLNKTNRLESCKKEDR